MINARSASRATSEGAAQGRFEIHTHFCDGNFMATELKRQFLLQQLGPCVRFVYALNKPQYQRGMTGIDLKPYEFTILSLLSENENVSQRQLSDTTKISQPNMAALIDRLEIRGLVRRDENRSDRRFYSIVLTEAGHAIYRDAAVAVEILESRAIGMLSPKEQKQLLALLGKVIAHGNT